MAAQVLINPGRVVQHAGDTRADAMLKATPAIKGSSEERKFKIAFAPFLR